MDAFWASLDPTRPSGDDPARVLDALARFYGDFHRTFRDSRGRRWKTELFVAIQPKLREDLNALIKLCISLQGLGKPPYPQAELSQLKSLDERTRTHLYQLDQEEKSFQLKPSASPRLFELNYLYQGWSRNFLPSKALQHFLKSYLAELVGLGKQLRDLRETSQMPESGSEEQELTEQTLREFSTLQSQLGELKAAIASGPEACRNIVEALLASGENLAKSFHRLESLAPPTTPCPFCQGSLSLSGRCKDCGRLLPHLEESMAVAGRQTSPFRSNNLRTLDLALIAWEQSAKSQTDWNDCQNSLRQFCHSVDSGNKGVEMLPTSADRPIDPESAERLKEQELQKVSRVFTKARNQMASFAAQSFPPDKPLEVDWRDELIDIEDSLENLQTSLQPS